MRNIMSSLSSETTSDNERRKNEVCSRVVAKSTRILYPAKVLDDSGVIPSSTASECIDSVSPPSTAPSIPSSYDEDYDKRLRQSITLTWKIPGEYRVSENVSKVYHTNRKRYIRNNRIYSGGDKSDNYDPKSTQKYNKNKYPGLKSIVLSKSSYKREKYHIALHETRSIKEVDRVRSTLKKLSGNSKCPYDCDCFDCYTLNMPEESSENSSGGEEIDPVSIYGGVDNIRKIERLKDTELRRNRRLAAECLAAQGDIKRIKGEINNLMTPRNSERFQHIEPLPDFVYEFEIMLENVRKESIFYDGIINLCRGLLYLWRCLLMKINFSRHRRVTPRPTTDQRTRDYLEVEIDPPLE